jgi:hypothetical protein
MRHMLAYCVLLLVLGGPHAAQAENLGRLFFTPAERNALDAGKFTATRESPALRGPQSVKLNGVVKRSDGQFTVWVNGKSVSEGGLSGVIASPSQADPAAARVRVRGASAAVSLRVGQRLEHETGKVSDAYDAAGAAANAPGDATPETSANQGVTGKQSRARKPSPKPAER